MSQDSLASCEYEDDGSVMVATARASSMALRNHARTVFTSLVEEFRAKFVFIDIDSGEEVWRAGPMITLPQEAIEDVQAARAFVGPAEDGTFLIGLPIYRGERAVLAAAGRVPRRGTGDDTLERGDLRRWCRAVVDRQRLLEQARLRTSVPVEFVGPSDLWPLRTLDQVLRQMDVDNAVDDNPRLVLREAYGLAEADALVWISSVPRSTVLVEGQSSLPSGAYRRLVRALEQLPDVAPDQPLLLDDVPGVWTYLPREGPSNGAECLDDPRPAVRTLLAFPIGARSRCATGEWEAWLLAINRRSTTGLDEPQFRHADIVRLAPFAALLEFHRRAAANSHGLRELLLGLVHSLTTALDSRDSFKDGHSERVALIAVELAHELGQSDQQCSDVYLAGLLHDVGKIGVRDSILRKPGPLTAEEYEHVKQHVTIGYGILSGLTGIRHLLPAVLHHHERWDGTGYPDGLAGALIPQLARILAVADAFDALTTARPHRAALPHLEAEEVLRQGAGTQWDPAVVAAFQRARSRIYTVRTRGHQGLPRL
jgi:HD-GYP domain-containing protein (c-di-GMP phosphodiesterase class II)